MQEAGRALLETEFLTDTGQKDPLDVEADCHNTPSVPSSCDDEQRALQEHAEVALSKRQILGCHVPFLNILLIGFGFMLNLGALNTAYTAQTVVLHSTNDSYFNASTTFGYSLWSISSVIGCFAVLLSPSIVAIIGPKITLVVGAVCTTLFVASFIRPLTSTTYIASVLTTVGTTLVWQVQGHFVAVNSTKKGISRNTGIFLGLFQSSLVFSNLFYFFMLNGKQTIPSETRILTFSVLTCVSAGGILVFSLLVHPWFERIPRPKSEITNHNQNAHFTPKEAFYAMISAMKSKDILFLLPLFFYMGIEGSFWSVYATALGYTEKFASLQQALVGLTNVFAGVGEIVGSIFIAFIGTWMHYNGRYRVFLMGTAVYMVTFTLIFLNIPPRASLEMTSDDSIIGPNPYIAMLVSFMLGFGDGIFSAQVIGYLGSRYRDDCVSVFAAYSFWSTVGNSAQFLYAMVLPLPFQLLILVVVAIIGSAGFCIVERKNWRISMLRCDEGSSSRS